MKKNCYLKYNKTFCMNIIKDCKYCDSCSDRCGIITNYCTRCKIQMCLNCKQVEKNFKRRCDKEDYKFCNKCHFFKICVQCWDVNQYKFLYDIVKKSIINFLICMKITNKNYYVPKPIKHLIIHYIVIAKYKIFQL